MIEIFTIVLLPLCIGYCAGVPYTESIANGWICFGFTCLGLLLTLRCLYNSIHDEVISRTAMQFRRANYGKGNSEEEEQFAKMFLRIIHVMELWVPGIASIFIAECISEYFGIQVNDQTDENKAAFESLENSLYGACVILAAAMIVGYKILFRKEDNDKFSTDITIEKKEEKFSSLIHHLRIVWGVNDSYLGVFLHWLIYYSMFVYAVVLMANIGMLNKEFIDCTNHSILKALTVVVAPSYFIYLSIRITINVLHSKCTKWKAP
ncbi:hypothetical protein PRIPAC_73294, partial [Pristionchus pacificus]